MRNILIISLLIVLTGTFYSCQDTLGIDDYKKSLLSGDTTIVYLTDTLLVDSIIRDTLILEKTRIDTIYRNDTIWKEVYHAYHNLSLIDGYMKNSISYTSYPFYFTNNNIKVTYTKENNDVVLFLDIDIDNAFLKFTDNYKDRNEIIKNLKIGLNGYRIGRDGIVPLDDSPGGNAFATIDILTKGNKTKRFYGYETAFVIDTYDLRREQSGKISSATVVFSCILPTESVIYDWLVLNGVLFIQF